MDHPFLTSNESTVTMAAPGRKFFIQDNIKKVAPHHESWEQLWNTKWSMPATMGVYPFMFGAAKDFEPILAKMKEVCWNDSSSDRASS